MKREELSAEKRKVTGKQVKKLRREGVVPANIYGKSFESLSIQLPVKDFETIYSRAHETGLVDLKIGGAIHPVLIHNVQRHPISKTPIHVDFYKVNLKEKVKTAVPVVAIGEAKAVAEKVGVLLQTLNEIEIEALPVDLPEHIEVPVENLSEVDDQILVKDITSPQGVTLVTSPESTVFRIGELITKEAEKLEAEEAAEAAAAAEEGTEATEDEGSPTTEQRGEKEEKPEGEGQAEGEKTEEAKKKESPEQPKE